MTPPDDLVDVLCPCGGPEPETGGPLEAPQPAAMEASDRATAAASKGFIAVVRLTAVDRRGARCPPSPPSPRHP